MPGIWGSRHAGDSHSLGTGAREYRAQKRGMEECYGKAESGATPLVYSAAFVWAPGLHSGVTLEWFGLVWFSKLCPTLATSWTIAC